MAALRIWRKFRRPYLCGKWVGPRIRRFSTVLCEIGKLRYSDEQCPDESHGSWRPGLYFEAATRSLAGLKTEQVIHVQSEERVGSRCPVPSHRVLMAVSVDRTGPGNRRRPACAFRSATGRQAG